MKSGLLQLSAHEHTGRVRPHAHTSYASLLFVLLLVGVLLLGQSIAALAATPAVNPQTGSVGLSGTVRGPAPSTAATIVTPRSGTSTNTTPITVAGTCPINTFVSINKNNVFGGVTTCQDDGTFTLLVELFDGANSLTAQVSDALGQFGPTSAAVSVFYNAPSLTLADGTIGKQLFLEASSTVVGGNPGESIQRSATIVGGTGPYAVSWDWGDGKTSLLSQARDGLVVGNHVYDRSGTYLVILRVTDVQGNSTILQLVTVVNGPVDALGATKGNGLGALPGSLISAWPLFLLALFMLIAFWLGERRELRKLRSRGIA